MTISDANGIIQDNDKQKHTYNIAKITNKLEQTEEDVWFSESAAICSYPKDSPNRYFGIENDSFWFRHRNDAIIAAVKKCPPVGFILDVGGANGYVTSGLEKGGFKAVLLEPSIVGVRNAQKRGIKPIIHSTVGDAGFKNNTISAVGLFDVLEHIEDERDFLKELKRILLPNGRLYLTVPAYQTLWSAEDEYTGHFRRYSLNQIKKTLRNSGFRIDYATHLFSYLPIPLFLTRTLPTKLGLAKQSTDKNAQDGNVLKSKVANVIISVFHKLELEMIKRKMSILFGGSLFIVAHSNI